MLKGVAGVDFSIKLNDALLQVNDMLDSIRKLKEENSELRLRLEIKDDVIEEEGYIVRKGNGDKDIKYCSTC